MVMVDPYDNKIEQAAVKVGDVVYTGKRHGQIMLDVQEKHPGTKITQDMQGFVDSNGKFWNRFQAGAIAFNAGQTNVRRTRLLSEDLW